MPAPLIMGAAAIAARLAAKKAASNVVKKAATKKVAKATARGLKAANKPTRASKSTDIKVTKKIAEGNKRLGQKEPYATRNAARIVDQMKADNRAALRRTSKKK
jgi:hypothetical protein